VSNNLNPQKEEEVKVLLKDHSVREIVKETGVSKNTIKRIRNENFTDGEKVALNKQAQLRGRNQREIEKAIKKEEKEAEPEIANDLPLELKKKLTSKKTQTNLPEVMPQNVLEPNELTFDDIAKKQFEILEKEYEELAKHIKLECAELIKIGYRITGLDEYIGFLKNADELTTDEGWKQYLEQMNDDLLEEEAKRITNVKDN